MLTGPGALYARQLEVARMWVVGEWGHKADVAGAWIVHFATFRAPDLWGGVELILRGSVMVE